MPNPVRIYVLHHPESEQARELTERIYEWFRLPNREGIPVYVRSEPARGNEVPADPYGMRDQEPVLEYFLPLLDDHLVRDPLWHDYLTTIADGCDASRHTEPPGYRGVMFPVALDSTAFNLPRTITRRNCIRHGLDPKAAPAGPSAPTELDTGATLKHLTEALARDLSEWLFDRQPPARPGTDRRFKVFISYARADGTAIPKALRDYIQSQTQCLAFLDENDIGFGQLFDEVLERQVGGAPSAKTAAADSAPGLERLARAMIVINGDHYAERPWCRWEIGRFTRSQSLPLVPDAADDAPGLHVFHPLLVVDALAGPRLTRVVPELAQAPMVRWEEGRARLCFTMLMREVVLGLRDVLVARQVSAEERPSHDTIFVNRLPGPVAIEQLLRPENAPKTTPPRRVIRYPGYGLPLMELRLLRDTFTGVEFRAFRDILPRGGGADDGLGRMREALEKIETGHASGLPLWNKVLSISTAHTSRAELASYGCLPQHQDEALLHLLRPLVRLGADLLYGGLPPTAPLSSPGQVRPSATRNITAALLRLVSEERREDEPGTTVPRPPRANGSLLFNVCAWPRHESVTPRDEAAWINTCRIRRFEPEEAGLQPWSGPVPLDTEAQPPGYRRYIARLMGAIRKRTPTGFEFRLPVEGVRLIRPDAFIFMGGKLSDFSGIIPGIMEEFLYAAVTGRPIYLFGGLGGASGVIARALCDSPGARRPRELTVKHYRETRSEKKSDDYRTLLKELRRDDPQPAHEFDRLWTLIRKHRARGLRSLFNNGLNDQDNETLLTTDNTAGAVQLAWKGISKVFLGAPADPQSSLLAPRHEPKASRPSRSARP